MSTTENFLLMQKCSALYVKASVPKNDYFNLKNIKSCGMNATGNATMACVMTRLHVNRSLDLAIIFTPLTLLVRQLVLIPPSCAKHFIDILAMQA
ncbi:hypothetical protein ARMGADRAFT_1018144 [Armillaria gallica]|uniref:Uncharacterized protein n=1 Tax=Armillaria gallica TaxID=47427 RepID=A0A2H3CPY6_ARMGA|nr:hypothetical protein ARMGADRAFT_1018144 [Armillaria gallica]